MTLKITETITWLRCARDVIIYWTCRIGIRQREAMIELKPCPFCGGNARLNSLLRYVYDAAAAEFYFYVMCGLCLNRTASFKDDEKIPIKLWNKRVKGRI